MSLYLWESNGLFFVKKNNYGHFMLKKSEKKLKAASKLLEHKGKFSKKFKFKLEPNSEKLYKLDLHIENIAHKGLVVKILFFDKNKDELPYIPLGWTWSEKYKKPYKYYSSAKGSDDFYFDAPAQANEVAIFINNWETKTDFYLSSPIRINQTNISSAYPINLKSISFSFRNLNKKYYYIDLDFEDFTNRPMKKVILSAKLFLNAKLSYEKIFDWDFDESLGLHYKLVSEAENSLKIPLILPSKDDYKISISLTSADKSFRFLNKPPQILYSYDLAYKNNFYRPNLNNNLAYIEVKGPSKKYDFKINENTVYNVEFFTKNSLEDKNQSSKAGLMSIEFYDKNFNLVNVPIPGFYLSKRFGYFKYLSAFTNDTQQNFIIKPSKDAKHCRLVFYTHENTSFMLKSDFKLHYYGLQSEEQIKRSISLIKDLKQVSSQNLDLPFVIIFTGTKPIGEGQRANRSMMMAKSWAKQGAPVIYVYYADEYRFLENPKDGTLLQVPNHIFMQTINVLLDIETQNKLLLISIPDKNAVQLIDKMKYYNWNIVYEARDEWEEFYHVGQAKWYKYLFEKYIASKADAVISVSPPLKQKLIEMGANKDSSYIIANATTSEFIKKANPSLIERSSNKKNNTKTIGYFGHLTASWFDWDLLKLTAERMPGYKFEIIGHGYPLDLYIPRNIELFGPKNHDEIIELSKNWCVGLIPFKVSKLSAAVDPIKIYEYLALGLKVVSCYMSQIEDYPITYLYKDSIDFYQYLQKALKHDVTSSEWNCVKNFVQTCSWEERINQTQNLFNDMV